MATQTVGLEVLETREWLDSLDYVLAKGRAGTRRPSAAAIGATRPPHGGNQHALLGDDALPEHDSSRQQPPFPGSQEMERRIKSLVRWNALAMVMRANQLEEGIGGHISTYASAATLYEVAFNHFLRAGRRTVTATSSTSRDTPRPASTRARFWKAAFPWRSWRISAASCTGRGCPRIRTRG